VAGVDERTFAARASGWINAILADRTDLPFGRSEVEEHATGGARRRDITIYDRSDRKAITGEVKMPDRPGGSSPYTGALVEDAHRKASTDGVEYFFTWNVNKLVVWKTFEPGTTLLNRALQPFDVADISTSAELEQQLVADEIRGALEEVLEYLADLLAGSATLPLRPLDERFIAILEAGLQTIINQTADGISSKQTADARWEQELRDWMVRVQDWVVTDVEWNRLIERSARLASYVLMMKLVFYESLRKRHAELPELAVPSGVETGPQLDSLFEGFFRMAMAASNDYETLFERDFGAELPATSDSAVSSWRDLVEQIEDFDFTRLDYDILGRIFERLIDHRERAQYGQYYTKPDVVDLINSFAIKAKDDVVLDPGCGGGTFLVRAYARKRYLGLTDHEDLLSTIFGVDLSQFGAHLSSVNLAVRELVDAANYPRVVHDNYFDVFLGETFTSVPALAGGDKIAVKVPQFDAIVGNPPYTRQELLDKDHLERALLRDYGGRPPAYSRRSDIHVYFWLHSAAFLAPGGRLAFLTSSNWLDALYGVQLQQFMLDNFRILAIMESNVEPWFEEARVATTATVLEREEDRDKRDANIVRFVRFDRPLHELLPHSESEVDRQSGVETLRDLILAQDAQSTALDGIRVRAIRQDALRNLGIDVDGRRSDESSENAEDDGGHE
jgi:SAM-dependent methyltransferase